LRDAAVPVSAVAAVAAYAEKSAVAYAAADPGQVFAAGLAETVSAAGPAEASAGFAVHKQAFAGAAAVPVSAVAADSAAASAEPVVAAGLAVASAEPVVAAGLAVASVEPAVAAGLVVASVEPAEIAVVFAAASVVFAEPELSSVYLLPAFFPRHFLREPPVSLKRAVRQPAFCPVRLQPPSCPYFLLSKLYPHPPRYSYDYAHLF